MVGPSGFVSAAAARLIVLFFLTVLLPVAGGGCAEVVAIGHVSDRDTSSTVNDVAVSASTDGRTWKPLGTTDPGGEYWILKSQIPSNARIRLAKRGYQPLEMADEEFLGSRSHLLTPAGTSGADPFAADTRSVDPFAEDEPARADTPDP